jgi:hypothetical protein
MGQIFFVNPFAKTQVTGGIKTIYNHAKLLRERARLQQTASEHWKPSKTLCIVSRLAATLTQELKRSIINEA